MRSVKVIHVADDCLSGIYFYRSTAPNEFYKDFILSADEGYGGALYFRDGDCNRILPEYDTADAGKFLRLDSKGVLEWQSLTNVAEEGA